MKTCRLCGHQTETKVKIGDRYVRLCEDCQNTIYRKIALDKNKEIIARIK